MHLQKREAFRGTCASNRLAIRTSPSLDPPALRANAKPTSAARRAARLAALTAAAVALAAPSAPAFATDHTWTGASIFSDNWNDPGNWNGIFNDPPTSGLNSTRIFFNGSASGTFADLNNNYSINELQFTSGNKVFNLFSSSGKTLTIGSGGITNATTPIQTISHAISIAVNQEWNAVNGSLNVSGPRSGTGLLAISANPGHAVYLGGDASLYTGTIRVDKGILNLNHDTALGTGPETLLLSGVISGVSTNVALVIGTPIVTNHDIRVIRATASSPDVVTIGTSDLSPGPINSGFSGQITIADTMNLQAGSTDRTTFSGKITGTGSIVISSPFGPGRRIVFDRPSGPANDFVGDVSITNDAVLQLGVANSIDNRTIPDASTIQFYNGGSTLRLAPAGSGDSETVGTLVSVGPGAGLVDMFTGTAFTLRIGADNESGTFGGIINDTVGALTINKIGTGTQTLSGVNFHSGGTRLSAGTLSISNDVNLGASTAPVTFAGGTLRVTGSSDVTIPTSRPMITSGASAIFDSQITSGVLDLQSPISGNGGLVKNGPGAMNLRNSVSTYTGPTTVNEGQFGLFGSVSEMLPSTTDVIVNGGTFLLWQNITQTIGSLSGNATVRLHNNGAHLRVGQDNSDSTFTGNIFNTGSGVGGKLTKIGTGTLTLTGNNTYLGGTTVASGKLVVNTNSLPASNGVVNNANLEFNQTFNGTYAGVISGMGPLIKTGGGRLTLNQANTLNGAIEVHDGTLEVGSNTALGAATVFMFGGGIRAGGASRVLSNTLEVFGSFTLGRLTDFTGPIKLNTSATIFIDNYDGLAGQFSDLAAITEVGGTRGLTIANGPLFGAGTGGILLTGHNTYTGGTTVNSGRLVVASTGSLDPTGAVTVNGGELKFENANQTVSGLSGTGGSLVLNPTMLTVNQSTSGTFQGNISGPGGLTKSGIGALNLTGDNTYSGPTVVQQGALDVSGANERLPDETAVTVDSGAFLRFFLGVGTETIGSLSGQGRVNFANSNAGGTNLRVGANNASTTFSGHITEPFSGTGSLTKIGNGTLTLTGNNTYTGGTTIENGILEITDNPNLGANTSPLTFAGGTLRVTNSTQVTLPAARSLVTDEADAVIDAQITGGFILDLQSPISGNGGLVKNGPATANLRNSISTYSGPTTINQGQFGLFGSISEMLPSTTDVTVNDGTFLLWQNITQTIGSLSGSANVGLHNNGAHLIVGQNNTDSTFTGRINSSGTGVGGRLTKIGTGTLTLTGNNTYPGGTTIDGGTLLANNTTGSATGTGGVIINSGGTLGGNGSVAGLTTAHSGGTVAPGASTGVLTLADLNLEPTATLAVELAGPGGTPGADFDQLAVTNTANLAGEIDVTFLDGFTPNYGDVFTILTADTISGSFTNRSNFIDAVSFSIAGQLPGVFRLGSTNVALVPLLKLNPSGDDTVTLITTAPGDLNLDGTVNIGDFLIFQNNFNDPGNWFDGDFNGDGLVNIGDFLLLQNNFNDVFFTPPGGAPASGLGGAGDLVLADFAAAHGVAETPEPTAALLLLSLGTPVLARRRWLGHDRDDGSSFGCTARLCNRAGFDVGRLLPPTLVGVDNPRTRPAPHTATGWVQVALPFPAPGASQP